MWSSANGSGMRSHKTPGATSRAAAPAGGAENGYSRMEGIVAFIARAAGSERGMARASRLVRRSIVFQSPGHVKRCEQRARWRCEQRARSRSRSEWGASVCESAPAGDTRHWIPRMTCRELAPLAKRMGCERPRISANHRHAPSHLLIPCKEVAYRQVAKP